MVWKNMWLQAVKQRLILERHRALRLVAPKKEREVVYFLQNRSVKDKSRMGSRQKPTFFSLWFSVCSTVMNYACQTVLVRVNTLRAMREVKGALLWKHWHYDCKEVSALCYGTAAVWFLQNSQTNIPTSTNTATAQHNKLRYWTLIVMTTFI